MESYSKLSKIIKELSSPIKLRILNLLCQHEMSLNELHKFIFKEYDIKYPQTTYNYIEKLVKNNIVIKIYDQEEKYIKYKLIGKNLGINLEKVSFKIE